MELTKNMLICMNRHMCLNEACELCYKNNDNDDNECDIWVSCDLWLNEQLKIINNLKE